MYTHDTYFPKLYPIYIQKIVYENIIFRVIGKIILRVNSAVLFLKISRLYNMLTVYNMHFNSLDTEAQDFLVKITHHCMGDLLV